MQKENPYRMQHSLKPFNGNIGGARAAQQGGKTWRDPKSIAFGQPGNTDKDNRNGNFTKKREFMVIHCTSTPLKISIHRAVKISSKLVSIQYTRVLHELLVHHTSYQLGISAISSCTVITGAVGPYVHWAELSTLNRNVINKLGHCNDDTQGRVGLKKVGITTESCANTTNMQLESTGRTLIIQMLCVLAIWGGNVHDDSWYESVDLFDGC